MVWFLLWAYSTVVKAVVDGLERVGISLFLLLRWILAGVFQDTIQVKKPRLI